MLASFVASWKKVAGVPHNVRCVSSRNFIHISDHVREMIKVDPEGWSAFGAVVVSDVESRNGGYVISFDPPFRSIVVVVSTKDLQALRLWSLGSVVSD